jgi:hypothetical protein
MTTEPKFFPDKSSTHREGIEERVDLGDFLSSVAAHDEHERLLHRLHAVGQDLQQLRDEQQATQVVAFRHRYGEGNGGVRI